MPPFAKAVVNSCVVHSCEEVMPRRKWTLAYGAERTRTLEAKWPDDRSNTVNLKELKEYNRLCDEMRRIGFTAGTLAGEDPPLRHERYLSTTKLSDSQLAEVQSAHSSGLPPDTWEFWKQFSDGSGWSRFYGRAPKDDLDEIRGLLTRMDEAITEYGELDVPESLEWDLPWIGWNLPSQEYPLDLVCRATGIVDHNSKASKIQVYSNGNFFQAIADSIEAWVGDRSCPVPEEVPEPVPESEPTRVVTIDKGDESFVLNSDVANLPVSIPLDLRRLFGAFVQKVVRKAPGESIDWNTLNETVFDDDADSGKASNLLRKAMNTLNRLMANLGRTPDGRRWIDSKKGQGASLNKSLKWRISPALSKELGRSSKSVKTVNVDPHKQARYQADE